LPTSKRHPKNVGHDFLERDQKEPKGLLQFYELQLISEGQNHIQEILESVNEKAGASWTLTSVMSTLRKLMAEGLVFQTSGPPPHSERSYEITSKGAAFLKEGKVAISNSDRMWFEMRGIFIDLMDARSLPEFLSKGATANFQLSREIIEAKMPKLDQRIAKSALGEYALNLRKQLTWTETKIRNLDSGEKHKATETNFEQF
jgi:DNA-binding PadR family transcriptional regulator